MKKTLLVGLGGAGDLILACQAVHWIQRKVGAENVELLCLARDETFEPIKLLFGDQIIIKQHELKEKWGEHYQLITNPNILKQLKDEYAEINIVVPDLLFRAREYSFNFEKYNTNPQLVFQTRLLTQKYCPKNIIYCAFANTTTHEYWIDNVKLLIEKLAELLPDYQLYVPVLLNWNNEPIINSDKNAELRNLPSNVLVDFNPPWERALSFMSQSCFLIGLDSFPFHAAFQFGICRLCLDPHFNINKNNNQIWVARWRNTGANDSIEINTPAELVAKLVFTNIKIPQTTLLPKWFVLNNLGVDWGSYLGFKF